MEQTKKCVHCGEVKGLDQFWKHNYTKDGVNSWCKLCIRGVINRRHKERMTTEPEYKRKFLEESARRKWRRLQDPSYATKIKQRAYQQRHSLQGRYATYRSRAKCKQLPFELTQIQFEGICNQPCYYCGEQIKPRGLDRIESIKGYILSNVRACCWLCNQAKNDSTEQEFQEHVQKIYNHMQHKIMKEE